MSLGILKDRNTCAYCDRIVGDKVDHRHDCEKFKTMEDRISVLETKNKHLTIQVKKLYRFIEENFRIAPRWREYALFYSKFYFSTPDRESDLGEL